MRHLGFPLDSELHPGKAVIYVDPDVGMRSCTKGGGDLNSSEFCLDDFPPSGADAKQQFTDNSRLNIPLEASQTILPMQTEPDTVSTHDQVLSPKDNSSFTSVAKNTQIQNMIDQKLDSSNQRDEHSINLETNKKEDDCSTVTCDSVLPSHSTCNLDANAQEFIPGNVVLTEGSTLPNLDNNSTAFGLSASAKEFFPSSSNSPAASLTSNISMNEFEARNCARCNKVRVLTWYLGLY